MAEPKTYQGSCHCGKVTYEVTMPLEKVMACNCSHCGRKGFLLTFVPPESFKLLSGEGELSTYHFNKHRIDHLFCKHCGVESFARGKGPGDKPTIAINARCLEGVDPSTLEIQHYNGRAA